MGYLTPCHQYFIRAQPSSASSHSIPWPLGVLSVGKGTKSPRLAVP